MTENVVNSYRTLFQVRLLHHYWLDEGATVFDLIADQAKKDSRLLTYDVRPLLSVEPTETTRRLLAGLRCVFRPTPLGCVVAVPGGVTVPADAHLEFIVRVQNSEFFDYTALTLRPSALHELFNDTDETLYRYRENVPVLSNLTGVTRGAGPNTRLFLSREIPAPDAQDRVEFLVKEAGGALSQLTGDNPGASLQQIAAQAGDLPVFVHQADSPEIAPPAGLAGVPARGLRLSPEIPDDVFALIRLDATRGDAPAFSFVDGAGAPKSPPPVYEVHFRNRSTVWTYKNARTGAVTSEPDPLPLTFFGNAGTRQKPARSLVKTLTSGTRVTQLISEIHV